jgi:8-oxo-dGTP pyrophosphatase MutT (NUDIX family)
METTFKTKDRAKFHIVLVQAVVFKGNKALIAQRSLEELQSPGLWALPGGKVESHGDEVDVIEQTLSDEFLEEVGIRLKKEMSYLKSGSFVRSDGASVVKLCFCAEWKSGEAQPLEDSIAVAWIDEDELDSFDFAPSTRELLELGFKSRK